MGRFNKNPAAAAPLLLALSLAGPAGSAAAQDRDFPWAPELPVGAAVPPIEARDQNGALRRFDDLRGGGGMLFMLSRSFDW